MGVLYRDEGKQARLLRLHTPGSRAFLKTLRIAVLFIAVACSSPSPSKQLAAPAPPAPAPDTPTVETDAAVAQALGLRGDACKRVACSDGLACVGRMTGGYCASACGVGHGTCDGTCIDTRDGELCVKSCSSDRDCRVDDGYLCDRQWHACLVPNFASVIVKQCSTQTGRDLAFGESELLSGGVAGIAQRAPAAVLTDVGGLITSYTTSSPDGGGTLAISRVDGPGLVSHELPLVPGRTEQLEPRLARDRKGTVYAVWHGSGEAGGEIDLASSADRGATWTTPIAIHDLADCSADARDCFDRALLVAGKDTLHVLYAAGDNGLRVRTSRDGGKTFTSGPIALVGTNASAVATSDGKLHVVAMTGGVLGGYGSAQQVIEYAASANAGATFTAPVRVSGQDETLPFFFSNPTLVVDTQRRLIYVAYARGGRDGAWDIVLATSKDAGVTWKRTKLAGDGCAIHMVPNLALDAMTGTLHIAYYDSEGAPGRFVHASCAPGPTKCVVHGAINSLAFTTLSTARQSSKWVGDYEALVIDGKRRLLHAVWAQTIDESGKPITRIFHAIAKLAKR